MSSKFKHGDVLFVDNQDSGTQVMYLEARDEGSSWVVVSRKNGLERVWIENERLHPPSKRWIRLMQDYMARPKQGARHGVPACTHPVEPNALYIRCMFHEWFFGPFPDEQAVIDAIRTLDAADPYWDYDCFAIHYGADPLPEDWVGGFRFIPAEMRERIEAARKTRPHHGADYAQN